MIINYWGKGHCDPTIEGEEVQVWLARLDGLQAAESWELLSDEEKSRAARLCDPLHSQRFADAHSVLRRLLGIYLGQDPCKLAFRLGPQGKPALANDNSEMLSFNISHSGDTAAFAFARGSEVGIDIECIHPLDDLEAMAGMVLSPAEWAELKDEPADEKLVHFFALWTRKEAVLKMTGSGLTISMKAVEFVNFKSTSETSEILLTDGRHCKVSSLPLDEGYIGAVATCP